MIKKYKRRSERILFQHLNQTFLVYSGKVYKNVLVTKEIINYRFGDFIFTRVNGFKIKKK
jgi:ribosomal protein S19